MRAAFHPVVDNPIRMAYVPGWKRISDLIERLSELELALNWGQVIPAPWEPFYKQCPCCRHAGSYAWARSQLQNPPDFAVALALFPGADQPSTTSIARANWLILCAKGETSLVTQKLMLAEALEIWETRATGWLEQIVETCAALGVETSVDFLRQRVKQALRALENTVPDEVEPDPMLDPEAGFRRSHGFDSALLEMDGWTQDFGTIILPVDALTHSLAREILLLDLHKVVLLKGRKSFRCVELDRITLIHLFEGAVIFEIAGEPALVVAGYKHPEAVLKTSQECYRVATERILQALATQVTRITP